VAQLDELVQMYGVCERRAGRASRRAIVANRDGIEVIGVWTRLLPNAHANIPRGGVPSGGDHDFRAIFVPDNRSKVPSELWRELESPQADNGRRHRGTIGHGDQVGTAGSV